MLHATAAPARSAFADELAADFLSAYDGHTLAAYQLDLSLLTRWLAANGLDLLAVTRVDLETWLRWLAIERGNAPATVRRRLASVRRFYRLLAHDGHVRVSPAEMVRLPRRALGAPAERAGLGVTRLELSTMLTAARCAQPVDAALVVLLGLMGLRVGEACSLRVDDALGVEQDHRVIRFVGKGGKPATVPIPPLAWRELAAVIGGRGEGWLLARPGTSAPMNRAAAARILTRLARSAGVDHKVTPHDLRRGFCTAMLDAGVSLRDVQEAGRWADLRMVERYDRRRANLDRHGVYALAAFIAGAA
ncbi:MAG TPA: tyrosine-type recombinase/integrase [Frankiaceae bacterium]|jgi:site-specific recombinase XerD|nr:tyrosine-type recombinase/integrase [Frankiaceae bacterium]